MFHRKGIYIDKQNNKYKKYISLLFSEVGDWKPLPKINFVALTKVQGSQTMHSSRTMGNSSTFKFDLFCVYLCADAKRKVLVCKSKNKREAISLATSISEYLDVSLSNYIKES